MDGAMTIGSEEAAHIFWRSPQQVDALRLAASIAQMTKRIDFAVSERRLKQVTDEVNAMPDKVINRYYKFKR